MKKSSLHVKHKAHTTPEDIENLLKTGKVGISPHIGNLDTVINPGYLQIITMIGGLSIELVDTVKMDDKDFHPRVISAQSSLPAELVNKDTGKVHLVTKKHFNRLAGSPIFIVDELVSAAILGLTERSSVSDLHKQSVKVVAEGTSHVETSSEMLATNPELGRYVMAATAIHLNRPLRFVDESGNISVFTGDISGMPIFGIDDSTGILAPVEALMAYETLDASLNGSTVAHIGGASMFNIYTHDPEVMGSVESIVQTVSEGYIGTPFTCEYVVLSKAGLARNLPKLGEGILTQYDLIHEKMAV